LKKKSKLEKENAIMRDLLYHLSFDAERVSDKYGVDDDDKPSDWKEWVNLRKSIQNAKPFLT